jgi:two-component system, NarL family, invasion response regulator UvrY
LKYFDAAMSPGRIKILVADDHDVVRTGVIKSLSEAIPEADFEEAANAPDVMKLILERQWHIIILDMNMPGRNGLDVLKSIKEISPDTKVVIFSMYPEDQFAIRSIKAGASAYLTKNISLGELAKAIRKVLNNEHYLTDSVATIITKSLRTDPDKPAHETLSNREFQVFLMIASGKSVSDIAKELSLSVKTISVYRTNILKKMDLKNNSEITHYAFKYQLLQ